MADVPHQSSKKRRLQGSCDHCRIRKIKCDSAQRPGSKCTNCVTFETECTHVAAMSRKSRGGTLGLESASILEDLQIHISKILDPGAVYTVPKDTSIVQGLVTELARYARSLECQVAELQRTVKHLRSASLSPPTASEDVNLMEGPMTRLNIREDSPPQFGGTVDASFMSSAKIMKHELNPSHNNRRRQFWYPHTWQLLPLQVKNPLQFPPPDLIDALISHFLQTTNRHFCFIHGPTLLRQVADGLHYTSNAFGSVVLAICAYSSRYSTDPRVGDGFHAGWAWYKQLRPVGPGEYLPSETALWALQLFPLMVMYAYGIVLGDQCWNLTGTGLRMCQALHLHRLRRKEGEEWTTSDEALKRVFWALVVLDVYTSALGGRPRMLNIDHIDSDYPLEVDDEFWPGEPLSDPENPWAQPDGIPSMITSWVFHLKVLDVYGFAQMTIYAVRRSKFWDSLGTAEWHQNVAVELDSALNQWLDSIPYHLRWNPQEPTEAAAVLYMTYYWVQIQIHRPFLRSRTAFSSIAICVTAARSCAHVLHVHDRTFGTVPLTTMISATLHSSIMLLMNAKNGLGAPRDLEDVQLSMQALARQEGRFQVAGRYHDVIRELFELLPIPGDRQELDYPRKRKSRPEEWDADLSPALDFYGVELNRAVFEPWDTWNSMLNGWQDILGDPDDVGILGPELS